MIVTTPRNSLPPVTTSVNYTAVSCPEKAESPPGCPVPEGFATFVAGREAPSSTPPVEDLSTTADKLRIYFLRHLDGGAALHFAGDPLAATHAGPDSIN